ncbi:aminotransferase class I/II-fold pyridoxal phosphate-dependent enzyme [Micromonospora sp. WMMD882]|uniref:aminotransferase class I/II-fold pyridoxal phosphate-dependent enzyme n=1 Tax=Micromonospora sp. WMMD882 TaxID=3015151 RepID=UPI00248BC10D|nr:aminotransferase class I/II-fold pyridoxal phosphate-dependent enzyme [Micromonospora sp. WMMD882]WBB78443.1 aminotransferase class I/II-fold pyridoxal phosphate-dependent enzyme [Micromonospora sp. WMMD882]
MTLDLTWTGSQFLDPATHSRDVLSGLGTVDLTTKDDTWADRVAEAVGGYFTVPEPWIRVGAGTTQLIEVLLRELHRGVVVDVVPNFHLAATVARQEGWTYHSVPVREPAELLPALAPYLGRADVTISMSSPRNPLGYQFDLADVEVLLRRAAGPVILDEVYADFAPDSALRLLGAHPNLYVARTFSKAWGLATLRAGFVASAAFADPARQVSRRSLPNSVSGITQRAVRHLLAHPEVVRESIAAAQRARESMLAGFARIAGARVWPSAANYVCLETPLAGPVAEALATAGYRARLLHDLRGYPESWPPGIRLSVPPQPHLDAVVACVAACHDGVEPVAEVVPPTRAAR